VAVPFCGSDADVWRTAESIKGVSFGVNAQDVAKAGKAWLLGVAFPLRMISQSDTITPNSVNGARPVYRGPKSAAKAAL
jgi:hypothetical protein